MTILQDPTSIALLSAEQQPKRVLKAHKGGQETNSRINQLILKCAESGWQIDVCFIETADHADRFALESACIAAFSPAWNRAR